ncbi:TonB-dependent receptor [Granulicella sp. dw_53]|uniref:TonB-dependent receptor n=1 Tax=Granulicella sp. dw_53 TaxID=2719792 RepID=UPI001BD1D1A8|nr:TonB-dependent receptor [Granulicella sp. dw_53]
MSFTAPLTTCGRSILAACGLRHLSLVVTLFVLSTSALAQIGGTGSMQGTISDPTGAVVPGATVTATNTATNAASTQQTSDSGFYSIAALPPGQYILTVTAPGFQTLSQEHVNVDALNVATVNLKLTIGQTTDTVTVSEAPPLLETANATLGLVMRNDVYTSLPLAMNAGPRDPTSFVQLVPGVQALSSQAAGSSFASFNGGQAYMNETYLEGIPMTSPGTQGETRNLAYGISVEAVDQFQVETNNSPAMYQGQGVENYTIKSGSNRFHGSAYEYFRNTVLDARGYFPTVAQGRPVEKQNQYGGHLGGFIIKDKLFFFANIDEYTYRSTSLPTNQFVPTSGSAVGVGGFTGGDFSALPTPIYDPLTTTCNAANVCTRTPFPGNIIPASRISPVAKSLQSYLPFVPTSAGIGNNYTTIVPIGLHVATTTERVDYNFSEKQRAYAVFSRGKYVTQPFAGISANTSAIPLPYAATRVVTEQPTNAQFHHVYSFTSNLLNQFGYAYARLEVPITSSTAAGQYPIKAGLQGLPAGQASNAFPTVTFSGTNAPQSWAGTNSQAFDEVVNTYVVQDNVQWTKGKHSVTMGGQFSWLHDNYTNPDDGSIATFTFNVNETAGYNAAGTLQTTTGNAYASYLLGAVDSSALQDNSIKTTGARYKDFAAYVQDDFRIFPNLTLNLGLRYDIFGVFHEAHDRTSFLNPTLPNPAINNYPGALQFTGNGVDSCHCATPIKTHYGYFGPRIGLAYSVTPKTVIRSGFAIMYAHGGAAGGRAGGRSGTNQLGYNALPTFASTGNGAPAFFWNGGNALPAAYANISQGGVPAYQKAPFFDPTLNTAFYTGGPTAGAITYGDPEVGGKVPEFTNYSLSIQHSITNSLTLAVGYTGSQGHNLPTTLGRNPSANQIDPRYLALGTDLNLSATPANITLGNAHAAALGLGTPFKLPYANFDTTNGKLFRTLLPFPQYTSITDIWPDVGNSNFNALQVVVTQRASNGLTLNLAYTFSKEMDNVVTVARTSYNPFQEYGLGSIDRKHLITSSANWKLPFGKGHRFASTGLASAFAGGFELSSVFILSSGAPLAITSTSCNTSSFGTGTLCVPNLTPGFSGPIAINGGLSSGQGNMIPGHTVSYINPAAFQKVPNYTFGNAPRTAPYGLRSPYTWNQDVTLRRAFKIWESLQLQTAVSAFNVYNTVNFGGVQTNIDSATFGTVSSQANAPRKLQAEARINF